MSLLTGLETLPSPSLLLFPDLIAANIASMIEICQGDPKRLRPHVKTHKLREVLEMQLAQGIRKVKCATIAEAELSAQAGVPDVLLAYQPVGPNIERLLNLRSRFPDCAFSAVTDCLHITQQMAEQTIASGQAKPLPIYIDFDCGMHRTGIACSEDALELAEFIFQSSALDYAGIHAYDGHIHQTDVEDRKAAFEESLSETINFQHQLKSRGIETPSVVGGGSPTFAFHAEIACDPSTTTNWECSPGTPLLWDVGYSANHSDLPFEKAAMLHSRVISKPGANLLCLDLGHKAVSAENPIDKRVRFPEIPDAQFISQSEEHLVICSESAEKWVPGDNLLAYPWHICPSLALYDEAAIVRDGELSQERWSILARRRRIHE